MTAILLQTGDAAMIEVGVVNILGLALLAWIICVAIAFAYRAHTIHPIPAPVGVLFGLTLPAMWLFVESMGSGTALDGDPLTFYGTSLYFLSSFVVGGIVGEIGRQTGDRLSCYHFGIERLPSRDPRSQTVRAAALTVGVTLPSTIDDVRGYDAIDDRVATALEERTMWFPLGLSMKETRDRIVNRLERDFDIEHAQLTFANDGTVETLAVGTRPGNISPSLPPGRVAVTIDTGVSPDANTGDVVEVWTGDHGSSRLIAIGRYWASEDGRTTITVLESDVDAFSENITYRLLARQGVPSDGSELQSVIDRAPETVASTSVTTDGPFDGEFVGWIPGTVVVIERRGDSIPFPRDRTTLQAGDTVYVLGETDTIRQFRNYEPNRELAQRSTTYE